MGMYIDEVSEQHGEAFPDASPISRFSVRDRERAIKHLFLRCRDRVGFGGGPTMAGRLDYILKHARERHLDARSYETVWFLRKVLSDREHVISNHVTEPAIAEETAASGVTVTHG